jgi:hypothetical protein
MANQVTHIVFAEKAFGKHFSMFNKKGFFIGTTFPDIRVPAKINRDLTHISHPSLSDVKDAPNSFQGGLIFHSLVDEVREEFVMASGLYENYPENQNTFRSMKILEGEQYYNRLNIWPQVIADLNDILTEEKEFPLSEDQIRNWHKTLQDFFSNSPSLEFASAFYDEAGLPQEAIEGFKETYAKLSQDPKVLNTIERMWDEMDNLISAERKSNLIFNKY